MAHDLILKDSSRGWGRGVPDNSVGQQCVEPSRPRMGWLGYTLAAMFATRILSGRWPWYWFGQASNRLEGKKSR